MKASGKALRSKGFLEVLGVTDDSKIEIPQVKLGRRTSTVWQDSCQMDKKLLNHLLGSQKTN